MQIESNKFLERSESNKYFERIKESSDKENYEQFLRFQTDLEFLQMLASADYLFCNKKISYYYFSFISSTHDETTVLARKNYFADQRFINYLKYLKYLLKPEFVRYIRLSILQEKRIA
jgi:hypothetical protein